MDPSAIFAIVAGTIIIVGRVLNRIAERSKAESDDTTHSLDAQHEFDDEESTPAQQNSADDTLPDTILAQILAEKHSRTVEEKALKTMPTKHIRTSQYASSTPTKTNNKVKKQQKAQQLNTPIDNNNSTSTSEIIEEFDLRKAVIYAEILKPKFDE